MTHEGGAFEERGVIGICKLEGYVMAHQWQWRDGEVDVYHVLYLYTRTRDGAIVSKSFRPIPSNTNENNSVPAPGNAGYAGYANFTGWMTAIEEKRDCCS